MSMAPDFTEMERAVVNRAYLIDALSNAQKSLLQFANDKRVILDNTAQDELKAITSLLDSTLAGQTNVCDSSLDDKDITSLTEVMKQVNQYVEQIVSCLGADIAIDILCNMFCIRRRNCEALNMCDGALPSIPHFVSRQVRYFYPKIINK